MKNLMTYGFIGMFAAFILASSLPDWLLTIPGALLISELLLATRKTRRESHS